MPITRRIASTDKETAEGGFVQITRAGVTYSGAYRVHAEGSGRQRYRVTSNKHVTVSYLGKTRGTSIGEGGLDAMVSTLLSELVAEVPN